MTEARRFGAWVELAPNSVWESSLGRLQHVPEGEPRPPQSRWALWSASDDAPPVETFLRQRLERLVESMLAHNLGSRELIALQRARLETLFGPPRTRGDDYKNSFSYALRFEGDGHSVLLEVADRKESSVVIYWEHTTSTALSRALAETALWDLLNVAPESDFEDEFSYDSAAKYGYRDGAPWVRDLPAQQS